MIKNKILPFLAATLISINSSLAADLKQAATSKVSNELNGAKNKLIHNMISSFENFITESFPRTEISVTGAEELKPQYEILTVQPLRDDGENITFFQGSLLRWDGERDTINLGLGQRKLLLNNNILVGLNTFYDHEFTVDHSRLGLGGEFITSVGEFRANNYYANSNQRLNGGNVEEAMSGSEYEFGTHVPYIPKLKVFVKKFNWDAGTSNLDGETYSAQYSHGSLTLEAGVDQFDSGEDRAFFKITLAPSKGETSSSKIIQDVAYRLESVEEQKLTKVRRENKILTSAFTVSFGGY
ncbi:inverse autotransporter beta domain-containing protein [Candidatus Pelagibacter ubique]|nr:inverse autotransporter beta domain-containing protein [Candidatus Pelagibacter ubique]